MIESIDDHLRGRLKKNKALTSFVLLSGLFVVLFSAVGGIIAGSTQGLVQDAYATGGTIDATTCEPIFGGTKTNTSPPLCDITNLTVGSGETVIIPDNQHVKVHGTVTIESGGTLDNNGGTLDILPGATVNVLSGGTFNLDNALAGRVVIGGTFNSAGTVTSSGHPPSTSGFQIAPSSPSSYSSGTVNISGGTFTVTSDSIFYLYSAGTLNISGGTFAVSDGARGNFLSGSKISLSSGGIMSITPTGNWVAASAPIVTINSGGTFSFAGTISGGSYTPATFNINSGGNFDISGANFVISYGIVAIKSGGTLNVSTGTFQYGGSVVDGFTSTGTINVNSGGTFKLGGYAQANGTINVNSGGTFESGGGVLIGAIMNVNSGGTFNGFGGTTITSGGNVLNAGILNAGKLHASGAGTFAISGKILILPEGNMTLNGGGFSVSVNSGGAILSSGGILKLVYGSLKVNSGGNVTLADGSELSSTTSFLIHGGTVTLTTGSTFNNGGSLAVRNDPYSTTSLGRLVLASSSTGEFRSASQVVSNGGSIFVNSSSTLNIYSGAKLTVYSGGRVDVFSGGTLNNSVGGTISTYGIVYVHCGGIFNNSGTLTGTITYEICLPATLSIQPDSKDFGSVKVGTDSFEATFTITNVGGLPTTPLVVGISGADSDDYTLSEDNCSATILALGGGSCTVNVLFNPSSEGDKTASLDVSATGTSTSSSLSGTGFVESTNSPPSLVLPEPQTGNELASLLFAVTATDADIGQTLTLSAVSLPEGATFDPANGQFSWNPTETQGPGDFSATFKVVDDGTPSLSDEKSVNIHVDEVNTAPTIENPGTQTFEAGSPIAPITFDVTDSDLPPNTLTFGQTGLPSWASLDSTTGTITGTPAEGDVDTSQVTVTVEDNGSPLLSDSTSFDIVITAIPPPPNQPPVAESQSVATLQDTSKLITLVGSDPDNDTLSFSIVSGSGPNYGTLSSLGSVIYNFEASLDGAQEVPPVSTAGTGAGSFIFDDSTNVLTFNIEFANLGSEETAAHIHGPASAGTDADILFPLPTGSPKVGSVDLDDLTDPSGARSDLFAGLWYVNVHTTSNPGGEIRGQIIPTGQVSADVTYTPTVGSTGSDGFEFQVTDGVASDTGIVQITVNAPGDFDGDGIPDEADLCLTLPETFNGFEDEDGCPDIAPVDGQISDIGSVTFSTELVVLVNDTDRDIDNEVTDLVADGLTVLVDRIGGDTETFDLSETGISTHIFQPDNLNNKIRITFVNSADDVFEENGTLELAPDDVELDIIVTYHDPLGSDSVPEDFTQAFQITTTPEPTVDLPASAGANDDITLVIVDGNLNDNALVGDSYQFTLDGAGPDYPLSRAGQTLDNIADISFRLNGTPLAFSSALSYTLVETAINSGQLTAVVSLTDIFSSAGIGVQDGDLLSFTYRNLMGSVNHEASDTMPISAITPPPDTDGDGVPDATDNCPAVSNADQTNSDNDSFGNACDPFPNDPNNDSDGDGVSGDIDNCPSVSNSDQTDTDNDGIGNACDDDRDGDNVPNDQDACPDVAGTEPNGCPPVETTIGELIAHIKSLNLSHGVETSLIAPIKNAQALLDDDNPSNDNAACDKLGAFTNQVDAKEKNGQLASDQAGELRSIVGIIESSIGC